MIFKIYGERNSGTNFLTRLLKSNFGEEYVFDDHLDMNTSINYYWKHGYPDEEFRQVEEQVIDIFIVRDLKKWLISMYHNPYCLSTRKTDCFATFLTSNQSVETVSSLALKNNSISKLFLKYIYSLFFNYTSTSSIKNLMLKSFLDKSIKLDRLRHPFPSKYLRDHKFKKHLNYSDESRNIFEIRYDKLRSYFDYSLSQKCIFVSLEDIQDNNKCINFLERISSDFNLKRKKIDLIKRNLKTYSLSKSTKYNFSADPYDDLIKTHQNIDLENHYRTLSYLK